MCYIQHNNNLLLAYVFIIYWRKLHFIHHGTQLGNRTDPLLFQDVMDMQNRLSCRSLNCHLIFFRDWKLFQLVFFSLRETIFMALNISRQGHLQSWALELLFWALSHQINKQGGFLAQIAASFLTILVLPSIWGSGLTPHPIKKIS